VVLLQDEMKQYLEEDGRRSIRLKDYDYGKAGAYFVTICTQKGKSILGKVAEEEMVLNKYGRVVKQSWNELSSHFLNTEMDLFVVMPNHIHGIIAIYDECRGGVPPPMGESAFGGSPLQKPKLCQVIGYFKYQTTKLINEIRSTPGFRVWQRNYYEHVIRNEDKLNKIRYYIQTNPLKWHLDRENQQRVGENMLEEEIFNSKMNTKP
jgi:REP element-mobilizing transposase RayT